MQNPFTTLLTRQTEITLYNIQVSFATARLEEEIVDQPVWRILYHALYRLDCGVIEPGELRRDPEFHQPVLVDLTVPYEGKPLTKEQLTEYYLDVKARLFLYLDEVSDEKLLMRNRITKETLFDTILEHLRYFTYQVGRINSFTALLTGKIPRFFNTDKNYPTDHQYFEQK